MQPATTTNDTLPKYSYNVQLIIDNYMKSSWSGNNRSAKDLPGDSWVPLRFFSGKEQTPLSPRCAATTEKRQSVQPKSEKKKTRTPQKTRDAYK